MRSCPTHPRSIVQSWPHLATFTSPRKALTRCGDSSCRLSAKARTEVQRFMFFSTNLSLQTVDEAQLRTAVQRFSSGPHHHKNRPRVKLCQCFPPMLFVGVFPECSLRVFVVSVLCVFFGSDYRQLDFSMIYRRDAFSYGGKLAAVLSVTCSAICFQRGTARSACCGLLPHAAR